MVSDYLNAITQEETVYKWVRRSEFTAKKAEADHARDNTVRGITAIVNTDMKHFDPSIRDNALHIHNLLSVYGNLTKADYDAETANIDSLVTRLKSTEYFPAVQNLNLVEWVNELHNQNELFKSYVDDTAQEQIAKPAITPIAARRQTDGALRKITNRITALVLLNGTLGYEGFITEFDVLVDHYNNIVHEHYGRLHARTDIAPAVLDVIPVQPFTGKPVFVIPDLTLVVEREGKQITLHPVFSEDFTVSYKNNIEPGTATLIIKGIGKYTGEIVTTFNIERE
jgi:hypothetical protein